MCTQGITLEISLKRMLFMSTDVIYVVYIISAVHSQVRITMTRL